MTTTLLTTTASWSDAGLLRQRLAEIHYEDFVPLSVIRTEREIVRTIKRLTGMTVEAIREQARIDASHLGI